MDILSINSVEQTGDYIHVMIEIFLPGYRFREVYCKHCVSTGQSRCFLTLHGNVCRDVLLTTKECDQINDYILSELLATA